MTEKFSLDTQKIALSSESRIYKTEGFISLTRKIAMIDAFISRVAEGIFKANISVDGCKAVTTDDGFYTLYICRKDAGDIVFYKFAGADNEGGTDRRLKDYLCSRGDISLTVSDTSDAVQKEDLERLYLVSSSDGIVNFPHLNQTQRKIVETEDSNMLVQGVAGSGKTNVCVEKIVY
ncbi:MAG: hypothetical protein J1F69_04090, partial [Clostridiales bacterium]|nr:hypothetical protein [Clostridiales bacterium]